MQALEGEQQQQADVAEVCGVMYSRRSEGLEKLLMPVWKAAESFYGVFLLLCPAEKRSSRVSRGLHLAVGEV